MMEMNSTVDKENLKYNNKISFFKSIRFKLIVMSVFVIVIVMAMILVFNNLLLERYYLKQKEKSVVNSYHKIEEILKEYDSTETDDSYSSIEYEGINKSFKSTYDDETTYKLNHICENEGFTLIVLNPNGGMPEYAYGPVQGLYERLNDLIMKTSFDDQYIVKYETEKGLHDESIKFMELYGDVDGNHYMLIRVATENIERSVSIANKFYMYVGIIAILISIVIVFITSSSYTKPILKLARLSEKMSNLDFSTEYKSNGSGNEIDILGNSMNGLSNRLEITIDELKKANEQLQEDIKVKTEIDEMRKEFISNVSHELKTPIALISGYAEGLRDGITDDEESRQVYCDVIVDEANKMNKMVRKLLTLNQIEFGKVTTYPDKFDIISVICGILGNAQIVLEEKNINVEFDADKEFAVYADEFQTEEVITNFISNAMNHCEEGLDGIKHIKIFAEDIGDKIKVSVFNTGKAIPEDELEKIWIKFYKVDKARTREYGGSGIGLSIVKAITNSMGTECGVVNENDGVTFFATFNKPKENDNDSNN